MEKIDCAHRPFFSKYSWITYCLTGGTIACLFCKTAGEKRLNLISYHSEDMRSLRETLAIGRNA